MKLLTTEYWSAYGCGAWARTAKLVFPVLQWAKEMGNYETVNRQEIGHCQSKTAEPGTIARRRFDGLAAGMKILIMRK